MYEDWIRDYVARTKDILSQCKQATAEMSVAFPELRRCRGWVTLSSGLEREHFWMETSEGEIVDPTVSQFTTTTFYKGCGGVKFYLEYDPEMHGPEPVGKCMACGAYCYPPEGTSTACTENCEIELRAYYGG